MSNVRIQASVQSGKAILRFRNGLENSVTVTSFIAGDEGKDEVWLPLITDPLKLRPGQIHSEDVSHSILSFLASPEGAELLKKRIRIRTLLDPGHLGSPGHVDCTVTFQSNRCTEFICH